MALRRKNNQAEVKPYVYVKKYFFNIRTREQIFRIYPIPYIYDVDLEKLKQLAK